jgi:hypothetical protein
MVPMAVDDWTAPSHCWTKYEERAPWPTWMNEHARYDRLRGEPRFQQLLRKIGFKELKFIPAPASE